MGRVRVFSKMNKKLELVAKTTCEVCYKAFNSRLTRIETVGYLIFVGLVLNYLK